jgi:hypothetical protein
MDDWKGVWDGICGSAATRAFVIEKSRSASELGSGGSATGVAVG